MADLKPCPCGVDEGCVNPVCPRLTNVLRARWVQDAVYRSKRVELSEETALHIVEHLAASFRRAE